MLRSPELSSSATFKRFDIHHRDTLSIKPFLEVAELLSSRDLNTCSKIHKKSRNAIKKFWQFQLFGSDSWMLCLFIVDMFITNQLLPKKIFNYKEERLL